MRSSIRTAVLAALAFATTAAAAPLRVVATVPELGSLARTVGGDDVDVTVLAKGTEDPHFVEAKPSFLKALSEADVLLMIGLDLETGYLPLLLQNARNPAVLAGGPGHVDCSQAITPLDAPTGTVDRSMGDVHPYGNPHYLLDPLNGLAVARLIRDRLAALRPEHAEAFGRRTDDLARRIGVGLAGETLASTYDATKLARLAELGKLDEFLTQQGDRAKLGGWLGALTPFHGAKVVDDHPIWTYFLRRFGLECAGHLEPKPGMSPTTKHLGEIVELMKTEHVRALLAAAYYDPRHARFVAEQTGARVAAMANQVGARPGTDDYVSMIDYDVRQLAAALGGGGGA